LADIHPQLVELLGERAAASLRGTPLGRREEDRLLERLLELRRLTAALSRELAPRQVAATVLDRALDLLDARAGTISWRVAPDMLSLLHGKNVPDAWSTVFERFSVHAPFPAGAAILTGEPVWLETEDDLAVRFPGLLPAWRAAGRPKWASVPLVLDDAPVGVLGVTFDSGRQVDALDRAFALAIAQECANALERARLYEEERTVRARAEEIGALLEAFIANVPTGLAFVDRELRYVRVNPALAAMNGVPAAEHAGKRVREVLSEPRWAPQIEAAEAALRDAIERGVSRLDEASAIEFPAGSGQLRHFLTSIYPVRTPSGAILGAGASVRDVTALREAQELQRLLVGIVGHDIRNPLGVIATSAALLATTPLDARQQQVVARIRRATDSIGNLAQQLLDYTVIQAGRRLPISPAPADLGQILAAIVDDFRALHPGRDLAADAGSGGPVSWDAERIRRLLANLLSNAVKYGDPSAPLAATCRAEGSDVVLEVTNRGPTVPSDRLARLFEPLQQGEDPSRRGGGIGLGLFIAREIAHAHGGRIEARSAEGVTTFSVRLPRRAPAGPR
jgi:PAS domain S-box-containing protein